MDDKEQHIPSPTKQETDEMWANVISRIKKQEKDKQRRKIRRFSIVSLAAILLVFGGSLTYRMLTRPDIYSAHDRTLTVILTDHSQVTLLKGARLTVEKSFLAETRDVFLEGDAVFQVSKSKSHPFIVHGIGYETKVLGTIFKVTQNGKTFNVDLYEGKVQITKNDKPKDVFVLRPKETFSNMGIPKAATIIATKNKETASIMRKATLSFDNTNLTDVVIVLEQTFDIKITFPTEFGNQKITTIKEKATPIDVIRLISSQLDLTIKNIDDKTFELEK
ncbi:FecR family protein [Sphingobacterium paramultivorum]|uniref:FecR family protein n=1 Tax=Sphingobacterium paramultivorum TaxID=2886510 RepID=UPI00129D0E6E|nr:FecR family protein [Sphingobacterium paramultivorum]